jgi:hypothetical protein
VSRYVPRLTSHRLSLAATLVLLVTLIVVPSASAYKLAPYRLSITRVTYFNMDRRYAWSVDQAASVWNHSGANIRFVRVSSQRAAKIVMGPGSGAIPGEPPGTPAVSLLHYTHQGIEILPAAIVITDQTRDKYNMATVIAHEFGHVLGLAHNRGCSLMNPSFSCETAPAGFWYCRILQADDVRGVVKLYGGKVHLRTPATCPRDDIPTALVPPTALGLQHVAGESPFVVHLTWTNVNSARLRTVAIAYSTGSCPTVAHAPGQQTFEVPAQSPGMVQSSPVALFAPQPGHYCFVAFSEDSAGASGAASAPAFYDLPAPTSAA